MDYTTTSKLKFAKLAGFKKKKPSKPKSKTLTQMKNYLDKYVLLIYLISLVRFFCFFSLLNIINSY